MNDKIVLPEQRINRDNFDLLIPEMEIPSGKIFGIFGPSGCGKSTYLELVLKHLKSRNYSIANAYQEDTIFENLTVKQNIELGYDMLGIKIKDEYFDEIRAFCNLLDITDSTLKKHGKQLSGGERRRVLISRVVSPKPDILLLDEPFVGIGIKHEIALRKIIRARRTRGKYTILVSHDKALLWAICDHIILIGEGRLLGSIEPQKLDYKSFNFKTAELLGIKNNLPFELLESTIDVEYISPALREFIAQEKKGILFWSSWITCKESDDEKEYPT